MDKRSKKVNECHGRSRKFLEDFPITGLIFQVKKVIGEWVGWWSWVVACRIIVSAPVPVPFLWTLDF